MLGSNIRRRFLSEPVVVAGRHSYPQSELGAAFRERMAAIPDGDARNQAESMRKMAGFVHEHSGIAQRHLEIGLGGHTTGSSWILEVNTATHALARRGLERAFEVLSPAHECDALIVVSSTHTGFPALSRRLQDGLGLPADALCFDLAGLGCAGPAQALQLADMLVTSGRRRVFVVCVDLMGSFGECREHHEPPTMSQLVAHCLASDGAAVIVVGDEPVARPALSYARAELDTELWPDSLGENDLTASPDNQPFLAVGKAIRTRLTTELGPLLHTLEPETTLFHPGGAKLVDAIAGCRPQFGPTLEISSAVLREHGNLGSPSLLWVLAEAIERARPLGPTLSLVALGPGIVAAHLCLRGVEVDRVAA